MNKLSVLLLMLLVIPMNESCKKVEKVTDNVMEYSLNKLGETFFTLIADSPEKSELKKKYDAFVARSINGEVDQEQIEYVAANMLNASNSQERINPQLAASIVETTEPLNENLSSDIGSKPGLDESKRNSLGDKLNKLLEFNEQVKQSYSDRDFAEKVFYRFDEGIEIHMDEDLKSILEETQKSVEIINEFQKNQDFTWVKDLSENLKMEQARFREQMKNLEKMEHLENLENLKELEKLNFDFQYFFKDGKYKQFYFNDTSFVMPDIPQVNLDSIMKSVQQSLKQAGLKE